VELKDTFLQLVSQIESLHSEVRALKKQKKRASTVNTKGGIVLTNPIMEKPYAKRRITQLENEIREEQKLLQEKAITLAGLRTKYSPEERTSTALVQWTPPAIKVQDVMVYRIEATEELPSQSKIARIESIEAEFCYVRQGVRKMKNTKQGQRVEYFFSAEGELAPVPTRSIPRVIELNRDGTVSLKSPHRSWLETEKLL